MQTVTGVQANSQSCVGLVWCGLLVFMMVLTVPFFFALESYQITGLPFDFNVVQPTVGLWPLTCWSVSYGNLRNELSWGNKCSGTEYYLLGIIPSEFQDVYDESWLSQWPSIAAPNRAPLMAYLHWRIIVMYQTLLQELVFFPRYGRYLCKDPATWPFWWLPLVCYGDTCSKSDPHKASSFPLVCLYRARHWCQDFLQVLFEEIKRVSMT